MIERSTAVTRVSRYDLRGKRLLERTEKYFAGDLGLRTARRGFHADAIAGILENIVFLELRRRGYQVRVGKLGEREVDFVAEKDGNREYYQVAYRLLDPNHPSINDDRPTNPNMRRQRPRKSWTRAARPLTSVPGGGVPAQARKSRAPLSRISHFSRGKLGTAPRRHGTSPWGEVV